MLSVLVGIRYDGEEFSIRESNGRVLTLEKAYLRNWQLTRPVPTLKKRVRHLSLGRELQSCWCRPEAVERLPRWSGRCGVAAIGVGAANADVATPAQVPVVDPAN